MQLNKQHTVGAMIFISAKGDMLEDPENSGMLKKFMIRRTTALDIVS